MEDNALELGWRMISWEVDSKRMRGKWDVEMLAGRWDGGRLVGAWMKESAW